MFFISKRKFQEAVKEMAFSISKKRKEEDDEHRGEMYYNIAMMNVGKPVIIVPDDASSIGIGIITGSMQVDPYIPKIQDYIAGKEVVSFARIIDFNNQNLEALLKLTPSERAGLIYRNHLPRKEGVVAKDRGEKQHTLEEIENILINSDFYEKAEEYWEKRQKTHNEAFERANED
jgi:hypothetical protein